MEISTPTTTSICRLGHYQDYVPKAFLAPECTRIVRWHAYQPYIPVNCIQLPPELIYMIAGLAPIAFAPVSHEYYTEFKTLAQSTWEDHKRNDELCVSPNFWFTRDSRLAIPSIYIAYRSLHDEVILRWAT